ncbi:hypothetical protein V6N13_058970 [Hibiscus sabdariffa]
MKVSHTKCHKAAPFDLELGFSWFTLDKYHGSRPARYGLLDSSSFHRYSSSFYGDIMSELLRCLALIKMTHFLIRVRMDDKGDVSAETTGPARAEFSADIQTSAERLAVLLAYP